MGKAERPHYERAGAAHLYHKRKGHRCLFRGTLYVEVLDADQPEGLSPGTIHSAGDEAVTIKLAKKVDGKYNSKPYTLKFTVVDDEKDPQL